MRIVAVSSIAPLAPHRACRQGRQRRGHAAENRWRGRMDVDKFPFLKCANW